MAERSGKSSPGNAQGKVVLGRRGGRFQAAFDQRGEARPGGPGNKPGAAASKSGPAGKKPGKDATDRTARTEAHPAPQVVPQVAPQVAPQVPPRVEHAPEQVTDKAAGVREHAPRGFRPPSRTNATRSGRDDRRRVEVQVRHREEIRPAAGAVNAVVGDAPVVEGGSAGIVLTQLAKMPLGATAYQLAQAIGEESREVGMVLRRLVAKGQVLESKGRYQVSGTGGEFSAVLEEERDDKGVAVLRARLPDGTVKTVNPRYTIGAKVGDVVQVMFGEDDLALVTRMLRRVGREVVGTIQFKPDGTWLVCDNRREGLLKIRESFPGFEDQYQVGNRYIGVIEADGSGDPGVKILRVLGKESPEIADFQYVVLAHDLPGEFPPEVKAQAEAYPKKWVLGTGKAKREDLREKLVFTIDPETAKDFDDAISLEYDEDGHWILGVHIADVSHYVVEGTPLDEEAVARGTSCYLVNRVIPMLPEVLSNGLCSLVPHEPRYCLSAFLTLDRQGKLLNTRLSETLIKSRHRFTYEEAMDVLVDRDVKGKWPTDVRTVVKETGVIAQILRRNRERAGALNLFSVEHRFKLDVNGVPIEIMAEASDASHQLIEECMLLANKAVAEWLEQQGLPCVYRLHQEPDAEKMAQFASVLEVYGKDSSRIQNRFGLQKMLADLAKEPPAARKVLNYLCLRAFKKAVYGTEKLGHYALAFASYAHFTSPIRRYPDLLVHRLVKRGLGLARYKKVEIRGGYLDALAKQASFLEQRAEQAERDLDARKTARYLAARIGESFPAVVVSAFPGGLSIQLLETGMDGMLPMRELRDDYYSFDPKRLCLVGRRSARAIGCGSELDVVVNSVDIERADVVFGLEAKGSFAQAIRPPKIAPKPAARVVSDHAHRDQEVDATLDERDNVPSVETSAEAKAITRRTQRVAPVPAVLEKAHAVKVPTPPVRTPLVKAPAPVAVEPESEPDEEPELLRADPPTASGRPVTKRVLSIDLSIDRRRVPERWRSGSSSRASEPVERDLWSPSPGRAGKAGALAKPGAGKHGKADRGDRNDRNDRGDKKKHRW
jgi:ribonuclease R